MRPVACWERHRVLLAVGFNPTVQHRDRLGQNRPSYRLETLASPLAPVPRHSLSLLPRVRRLPARRSGRRLAPRRRRRKLSAAVPFFPPPFSVPFSCELARGGSMRGRGVRHRPEPRRCPAMRSTTVDGGATFAPGGVLSFRSWWRRAPHCPGSSSHASIGCAWRSSGTGAAIAAAHLCRRALGSLR
jgi:hypothetical protein